MIPKKKKSCWYKNTVAHTTYAHEIIALNGFRPFIFLPWEHPMHVNACFLRNFHTSDSIPFHSDEMNMYALFTMKWNSIIKSHIRFFFRNSTQFSNFKLTLSFGEKHHKLYLHIQNGPSLLFRWNFINKC